MSDQEKWPVMTSDQAIEKLMSNSPLRGEGSEQPVSLREGQDDLAKAKVAVRHGCSPTVSRSLAEALLKECDRLERLVVGQSVAQAASPSRQGEGRCPATPMRSVRVHATLKDGSDWTHDFNTRYMTDSPTATKAIHDVASTIVESDLGFDQVQHWFWQFNKSETASEADTGEVAVDVDAQLKELAEAWGRYQSAKLASPKDTHELVRAQVSLNVRVTNLMLKIFPGGEEMAHALVTKTPEADTGEVERLRSRVEFLQKALSQASGSAELTEDGNIFVVLGSGAMIAAGSRRTNPEWATYIEEKQTGGGA